MLVYVAANSGSYRYGVSSVYHDVTSFCIHIDRPITPKLSQWIWLAVLLQSQFQTVWLRTATSLMTI